MLICNMQTEEHLLGQTYLNMFLKDQGPFVFPMLPERTLQISTTTT